MRNVLMLFLVLAICSSCRQEQRHSVSSDQMKKYKDNLVAIHKELVRHQADSIRKFVNSKGWVMSQSRTGLCYEILNDNPGPMISAGNEVYVSYSVSLLDGFRCYSSDSLGYKSFVVGRGGVEAGLEEGVLLLSKGDSARFILPSYLAYGVAGDQNRIPRLSIIIYDLKVVEVVSY